MKRYIQAFDRYGNQILGNCDGQAVITNKNYKQTTAYKRVRYGDMKKVTLRRETMFFKVVDENDTLLEQFYRWNPDLPIVTEQTQKARGQ